MPETKVLIADDHTVVRAGLRNALEALPNFKIVQEVGNGIELMNALANTSIDLLLMDASMPEFEPISAVRKIKAEYPKIKILIVSAYDDESYVLGLLRAGANGYHMKDQPLSDLQLATQRIMNGDRWISGSLIDRLINRRTPTAQLSNTPWLTPRQRELLRLISQGVDNRNIALTLDLSVKTVENHLTALYRVLGVDSRLKALNYVLRHPELLASSGQEMADSNPKETAEELTILIVDDNARYRQQLGRLIGKIYPSSVVYEAESIAEALSLSKQVQPQLSFIDVFLNDEDGIQFARKLKTNSPLTHIVIISAYPDREFRKQAQSAGVIAFLDKKDLDKESMRQIIEDALQ
ncbi:MAG: response regulator transcription factor [Anaerolineales bacterium]|nr:response regulator transcription factor [Anaerolineales bacterium]MBX3037928.1 response regulator transcription factor [Anaerolineales bacterium]